MSGADLRTAAERHEETEQAVDARAQLWDVLAAIRDAHPRHPRDAATDELLDALLDNDALGLDFIAQGQWTP